MDGGDAMFVADCCHGNRTIGPAGVSVHKRCLTKRGYGFEWLSTIRGQAVSGPALPVTAPNGSENTLTNACR